MPVHVDTWRQSLPVSYCLLELRNGYWMTVLVLTLTRSSTPSGVSLRVRKGCIHDSVLRHCQVCNRMDFWPVKNPVPFIPGVCPAWAQGNAPSPYPFTYPLHNLLLYLLVSCTFPFFLLVLASSIFLLFRPFSFDQNSPTPLNSKQLSITGVLFQKKKINSLGK